MDYSKLFTPYKIGNMTVKNRFVLSPMGTGSSHIDGTKSDTEVRYYEARAKGGTGLIILGCQMLTEELAQGSLEGTLEKPHVIPKLTEIVESCHRYGAKVVCQVSPGTGRNAFASMHTDPPVSASAIPSTFNPDILCHPLSHEEIQTIMEQFTNSADIAVKAGFDAIEVHAHAGYLIDQFMSEVWNKRTDEYGGSAENRSRFPREIVRAIRKATGPDMPILFRIAVDHIFEGGRTIEETIPLLKLLEEEGVDAFDIDAGSYEMIDYIFPPAYLGDACMAYVCEETRKHVSVPILNAGNHTPETAVELLDSGNADFVMFGRPLIADPDMPNKIKAGRREDVRPCIRCNEECVGRIVTRLTKMSCAVNIQACEEGHFVLEETNNPQSVLVIGAGPGGLEAARVAATCGHNVTLVEKEADIGGQLTAAATPDFKYLLKELVEWYRRQLKQLQVDVKLNYELETGDSLLKSSDRIIVATGATPLELNIPGKENDRVIDVIVAHKDKDKIVGDNIVICGGGLSGCDCALELAAEHGKKVTIIEMLGSLAQDILFLNAATLFRQLEEYGVKQMVNTKVVAFEDDGVRVVDADGNESVVPADTIITAFGMKSNNELAEAIQKDYHLKTQVIGDCSKIGKVGNAIRGGFYAALNLDH
ncbi:MAG TPA: FAD-dependent oxidoreductase [Clostridiaceae bacterium]|nr:FAD-dependent oxidoreductase [Clostridiaceae bacterium]